MTKQLPLKKGWFIWMIKRVYGGDPLVIAQKAKEQGISWVSIKVNDGASDYNLRPITLFGVTIGYKDDIIQPLIDALAAQGIETHGWGYIYLLNSVKEAQKSIERVKKFNLKSYMVDAESEWKNKANEASSYMNNLRLGLPDTAIGLCSFRFPSLQNDFPWKQAITHIDFHVPQVYWVTSHNVIEQVDRSFKELKALKDVPQIPIASAYKYEYGTWLPSEKELSDFNDETKKLGSVGNGYYEWGDAINADVEKYVAKLSWDGSIPKPPDPPPPDPDPTGLKVKVKSGVNLNLRNLPTTIGSTILLTEKSGSILTSLESDVNTINKINKTGEWLNVQDINNNQGFCSSTFLELVNDIPNPPPPKTDIVNGTVSTGYINVRTGPGTNFSISVSVPSVKLNRKLSLISPFSHDASGNVWAKINDDGNNWVCLRYNGVWYVNLVDKFTSFVVPSDGEYVQTNHDYESTEYNYTPRSIVMRTRMSLPETINLIGAKKINDFYPLNKEWQEFIFALMKKADNGVRTNAELITAWKSYIEDKRCFTDHHAPENGFHDWITGRNPNGKDVAWKSLSTGGNLLKVLEKNGNRLTIEAIDISKSPPDINDVWGKNHLIHWATQETVIKLSDGTYRVVSFPQLSPYFGTPFPVLGVGGFNVVTTDLVHSVENNKVYNIYNNI